MKVFLKIYSLFIQLAVGVVSFSALFIPKLKILIQGHRGLVLRIQAWRRKSAQKVVWFHVASAGELEQAIPLMEKVQELAKDSLIFVSYFSPSGAAAIKNESKRRKNASPPLNVPWHQADYLCWDTTKEVKSYVQALNPSNLVCMHAELWPNLFYHLAEKKIPVSVAAVYLPRLWKQYSSLRALYVVNWIRAFYLKTVFKGVSKIATVDPLTQKGLVCLFPEKDIQVLGDPRMDRVLDRSRTAPRTKTERNSIVLASIKPEDWNYLKTWLVKRFNPDHPEQHLKRTIYIVPHEPSPKFLKRIQWDLKVSRIDSVLWSQLRPDNTHPIIVIDVVGLLAELYSKADIAFVGGAYSHSVHNVLEPAAYANAIVTGPKIYRSAEATEMLGLGALLRTDDEESLVDALNTLVANEKYTFDLGLKSKQYLTDRYGAKERYKNWISETL